MHVSLIRPPAYSVGLMGAQLVPFLGIGYIAASARAAGHSVDVIDMCGEDIDRTEIVQGKYIAYGMRFDALRGRISPSRVIGITCMFSQDWPFHRDLIKYIRTLFPDAVIVAGGEHVTAVPEFCLQDCPDLDFCVIGEGERVFCELLAAIERGETWSSIAGLAYKKNDLTIHRTPRNTRINDIDAIPRPAWDLMPMEQYLSRGMTYHIQRGRTMPMLASRGCPYKCSFCSNTGMWGHPWLARDARSIVDEIELYIKEYSAENFVFSDLTAVVRRDRIIELCEEILSRRLTVTWQLPTLRTEALDKETLSLMYRAGCRELDFALESGSMEVLASVHKKNEPAKMSELIKNGLSVGFNFSINIILGLPSEGFKDFFKTYRMVIKLAVNGLQEVNAFPFIPYPGSPLFRDFMKEGKITLNDDYFFGLFGYADLSSAVSWSEKFSPGTLRFLRLFLMGSFYSLMFISHPMRIIIIIGNLISGKRPVTKIEGVVRRILKNMKAYFSQKKKHAA